MAAMMGSRSNALGIYTAVALLAGCGGSQLEPAQVQSNAPQTATSLGRVAPASGARTVLGWSWIAPEAKQSDLAYVSGGYHAGILAFTYPRGKYVGSIATGADAQGLCAAKNGNWWVVAADADEVLEYAHGGTMPLKTLNVSAGEPAGCAVDPTTGNLAVTILGTGSVVVFTRGSGSGTTTSDGLASTYFDGYDDKGNLFADGLSGDSSPGLVELPKGGSTFVPIKLSRALLFPGGVQWHERYLAVGDQEASAIYHFAIHGGNAKEIGVTRLGGGSDIIAFWIQKRDVVAADAGNETAAIWKYPSGGAPIRFLSGPYGLSAGITVSVAK
jgi:hypothetical protein